MANPPTPLSYTANSTFGMVRYGKTGGMAGQGQTGFNINTDGRGLLEGTWIAIYEVDPSLPRMPNIPRRGQDHPTDSRLKCYKVDCSFSGNGEVRVTASYIGLEKDPTDAVIEISGSTSETSIVFHPDFPTWAMINKGSPGSGNQPAVRPTYQKYVERDQQGNFQRFMIGVSPGDLGGVEAYLTPKCTLRLTFYTGSTKTVQQVQGGLGRAVTKPSGVPDGLLADTKANWLLTSAGVSEYGNVFKVSQDWMLSESGKPWNQYIYGGSGTSQGTSQHPLLQSAVGLSNWGGTKNASFSGFLGPQTVLPSL